MISSAKSLLIVK